MKSNPIDSFQPRDGGESESFNLKMLETRKTLHLPLGCQQGILVNKHLFHQVDLALRCILPSVPQDIWQMTNMRQSLMKATCYTSHTCVSHETIIRDTIGRNDGSDPL